MSFVREMLSETGKVSTMRVAFLFSTAVFVGGWLYVAIQTRALPDLPWNVVTIILGLGGVKVLQKAKENGNGVKPEEGVDKRANPTTGSPAAIGSGEK